MVRQHNLRQVQYMAGYKFVQHPAMLNLRSGRPEPEGGQVSPEKLKGNI